MPRRLSEAMATQFLPDMAIIAAPLYSRMDIFYLFIYREEMVGCGQGLCTY